MDAKSVLFVGDGGTMQFVTNDSVIIPDTVRTISGINSATVKVEFLTYRSNTAGFGYRLMPEDDGRTISNLTVICSTDDGYDVSVVKYCRNLINVTAIIRSDYHIYGFGHCSGLTGCIAEMIPSGTAPTIYGDCYYDCDHLINCSARILPPLATRTADEPMPIVSDPSYIRLYRECKYLINCYGNYLHDYNDKTRDVFLDGFESSEFLVNCETDSSFSYCNRLISCQGSGFSVCRYLTDCTGDGYYACHGLSNCTAERTSDSSISLFSDCTELNGCIGKADTTSSSSTYSARAFDDCTGLSNCIGTGAGKHNAYGFYNCRQLSGCRGTGLIKTNPTDPVVTSGGAMTSDNGYGFYNCSYLNGCKQGDKPSSTAFLGGTNTRVDTLTVVAS